MKVKEVVQIHTKKLDTLDSGNFNEKKWRLAVAILVFGVFLGFFKSWWYLLLGFVIYSILAYQSVDWFGDLEDENGKR